MPDIQLSNPMVRAQLQTQLQVLMTKAAENKNPDVYAWYTLEETAEPFYPVLRELVGDDSEGALQRIAEIEPGVMSFADWFMDYGDAIREQFIEAEKSAQENALNTDAESGDNEADFDSNQPDVSSATEKTAVTADATD